MLAQSQDFVRNARKHLPKGVQEFVGDLPRTCNPNINLTLLCYLAAMFRKVIFLYFTGIYMERSCEFDTRLR